MLRKMKKPFDRNKQTVLATTRAKRASLQARKPQWTLSDHSGGAFIALFRRRDSLGRAYVSWPCYVFGGSGTYKSRQILTTKKSLISLCRGTDDAYTSRG